MTYPVLALDVDGVLTDGGISLNDRGEETLRFHVLDGYGIVRWITAGRECIWVSARRSPPVEARAAALGVRCLLLDVSDKVQALETFLRARGYRWEQVVYVGDDIVDIEPIRRAGMGIAVRTAIADVKAAARYVTTAAGGQGAVREVIDMILSTDVGHDDEAATTTSPSDCSLDHSADDRCRPCIA